MRSRGFTLVEVITVMLIMSLAAVVVLPVMSVLLARISDSQDRRRVSAQLHTALDQMTLVAREWPASGGALEGLTVHRELGVLVGLEIPGAGGFRQTDGDLVLINAAGQEGLLCPSIESFRLTVTGRESQAELITDEEMPGGVTVRLEIQAAGVEVSGLAFVRSMGGSS